MSRWLRVALFFAMAVPVLADDAAQKIYSDSFKKGATQVKEQSLDVNLVSEQAAPEFKILDSNGKPRYILRFAPDMPRGDTKVVGWFVRLADLHHKIYDSVLPTSPDSMRDTTQVWWLDGRPYAKLPLKAARVFKVESFYCVVQVKDAKRLSAEKAYLSELDLTVQFTNTKP